MADPKDADAVGATRSLLLRVRRGGSGEPPRVDEFEVSVDAQTTLHGALCAVRARPITTDGRRVDPPAWEASCLEGSCGGCTVRAGGRAELACSTPALALRLGKGPLLLEPLARFPVVRDLIVDRSRQDEALGRARPAGEVAEEPEVASGETGATHERPEARDLRSALAACIACGACTEACPETGDRRAFVGAEAIAQNRLAALHPLATAARKEELARALMAPGGVADCGHAQACVEACPAEVPLVEAIATAARDTSARLLFGWMRR